MKKVIYKYQLKKLGTSEVRIPVHAEILSVASQYGQVVMFALVSEDGNTPTEVKHFESVYTGQSVDADISNFKFLGTVMFDDGTLVSHIFEH